MTKLLSILLVSIAGFFLMPAISYACHSKEEKKEKACCQKSSSTSEERECCKKGHVTTGTNNEGCGGKCKNPSCHCPAFILNTNIILPSVFEAKPQKTAVEKQLFFDREPSIVSGFYFVWLLPKIS